MLHIKHQTIDKGCPWQNGRIERFFGTLKEKLNLIDVEDINHLNQHLQDFSYWYNHIRTHQNLDDRTPFEVWARTEIKPQAQFFSAWNGLLTGFKHPPEN